MSINSPTPDAPPPVEPVSGSSAAPAGGPAEEYERRLVPEHATKPLRSFIAIFSSEHVAATELLIGPLFVVHGVGAFDLLVGLLLGNALAVLSWTFITAPIAVMKRLTLYYQLEKIGGARLVDIYNLANGVLWCFIAAAMISVSATAVGVPLKIKMPELTDYLPNSVGMVVVVFVLGAVISVIAARGYDSLARFAVISAPWMAVMFVVVGIVALAKLGVSTPAQFWDVANNVVWKGGNPQPGFPKFTFWHVLFFSWFGNIAWHIGMGDLSLFRYARKSSYGLASATGMYLGHYIAWIAAGLLYAIQLVNDPSDTKLAAGPLGYNIGGVAGIALVLIAGWTTANPIIYRAGLAFQGLNPKWSRFRVTLAAGALASIIAVFPGLSAKFLSVAALYGLILMPMGAVIFADHYWMKPLGMREFYAEQTGIRFYLPPAVAWLATLLICLVLNQQFGVQIFFLALPAWFIAAAIYIVLSKMHQRNAGGCA